MDMTIFTDKETQYVQNIIRLALLEDERDLTAEGIFKKTDMAKAKLIARENTFIVGLPLIPLIFQEYYTIYEENISMQEGDEYSENIIYQTKKQSPLIGNITEMYSLHTEEGSFLHDNDIAVTFYAPTVMLLKVERIILNFITHMSGIANKTKLFLKELEGTKVKLLDTRKTLPGHRYLEKYAVRIAGGQNHRKNLSDMLMIKNNHVDAAGSITLAIETLRKTYQEKCPPIVVECRDKEEVLEAIKSKPTRILLDNMNVESLALILPLIPYEIEAEISGGVNLQTIRSLALSSQTRPADFISVGSITHSAPIADFSLRIQTV